MRVFSQQHDCTTSIKHVQAFHYTFLYMSYYNIVQKNTHSNNM